MQTLRETLTPSGGMFVFIKLLFHYFFFFFTSRDGTRLDSAWIVSLRPVSDENMEDKILSQRNQNYNNYRTEATFIGL